MNCLRGRGRLRQATPAGQTWHPPRRIWINWSGSGRQHLRNEYTSNVYTCDAKRCTHYFKCGVRGGQPRHQSCITFNLFIISKAEREAASLAIKYLKSKAKFKYHHIVDNDNETHIRRIMLLYRISNIRIVSYSRSVQLWNIGATYPPLQTRQSYTLG